VTHIATSDEVQYGGGGHRVYSNAKAVACIVWKGDHCNFVAQITCVRNLET